MQIFSKGAYYGHLSFFGYIYSARIEIEGPISFGVLDLNKLRFRFLSPIFIINFVKNVLFLCRVATSHLRMHFYQCCVFLKYLGWLTKTLDNSLENICISGKCRCPFLPIVVLPLLVPYFVCIVSEI